MAERFFSLGTLLIFSVLLPGILMTGAVQMLKVIPMPAEAFANGFAVFGLGFAANAVGHVTGHWIRRASKRYREIPFGLIYQLPAGVAVDRAKLLRDATEYWFSAYCLYWNSFVGLLLVGFVHYKVIIAQPVLLAVVLVLEAALVLVSKSVLDGILVMTGQPGLRDSRSQAPTGDVCVEWMEESDVESVASFLDDQRNAASLWYGGGAISYREILPRWLAEPGDICLVLRQRGEGPVGFLRMKPWLHGKRMHVGAIGPIAVHPDFWRRGHGLRLMLAARHVAKNVGISRLEGTASEERMQFTVCSKPVGSLWRHGRRVPCVATMVKQNGLPPMSLLCGRMEPPSAGRMFGQRDLAHPQGRGRARLGWMFTFAVAAYNLVRLRNLRAVAA
jgi:GNAT superfamily N-acetyltransferase